MLAAVWCFVLFDVCCVLSVVCGLLFVVSCLSLWCVCCS